MSAENRDTAVETFISSISKQRPADQKHPVRGHNSLINLNDIPSYHLNHSNMCLCLEFSLGLNSNYASAVSTMYSLTRGETLKAKYFLRTEEKHILIKL